MQYYGSCKLLFSCIEGNWVMDDKYVILRHTLIFTDIDLMYCDPSVFPSHPVLIMERFVIKFPPG